jgi:hypothetical protein
MKFNANRLLVDNLKKIIQLSGTWAMHNPVVNDYQSQRTEATTEVIQLVSEARKVV